VVKVVLLLLMRREKFVLQLSGSSGLVKFGFWFCFGLRAPSCWQRLVTIHGVVYMSNDQSSWLLVSNSGSSWYETSI
jgi:hypothetical protein